LVRLAALLAGLLSAAALLAAALSWLLARLAGFLSAAALLAAALLATTLLLLAGLLVRVHEYSIIGSPVRQ
jgi:nitric oxide reductase large subunit